MSTLKTDLRVGLLFLLLREIYSLLYERKVLFMTYSETKQWYKEEAKRVKQKPKSELDEYDEYILRTNRWYSGSTIIDILMFPITLVVALYRWSNDYMNR